MSNLKYLIGIALSLMVISCQQNPINEYYHPEDVSLQHNQNDSTWYNRKVGITKSLLAILQGNAAQAIVTAREQGHDAEAFYVMAAAHTSIQQFDSAMFYLDKATHAGMPPHRFLAGPEEFFGQLYQSEEFQKWNNDFNINLVQGPMVGTVTSQSAIIWARTNGKASLAFIVSPDPDFSKIYQSEVSQTSPDYEFTAQLLVSGLSPNTEYYYKVMINNTPLPRIYNFSTQPAELSKTQVSIAFGGGAAYIPWHTRMWDTLATHDLNGLLMLGDNIYIDYPEHTSIQQFCYHQRQSEPSWQRLVSRTPVYAIWDDHDFGDNDEYGGPEINQPEWKIPVWKTFKNQWANASYGGGENNPGVWFNYIIGDVEFFMLDCRYYREGSYISNPRSDLSMLGPVQKQWLLDALSESKATFKVIASSVPWAFGAKPEMEGRFDTWKGYPDERDEIFNYLTENQIEGVILLSADRHRSDLWKIERAQDYPLYEMESSRLTNVHRHNCMPGALQCYNEKNSFGKIVFNTMADAPFLQYQVWSIDNEMIWEHRIDIAELKYIQ